MDFVIGCGVGRQARGQFDLEVRMPGAASVHVSLPCDPEFRALNWFGFSSEADGPATFYLDNLTLGRVSSGD